MKRTLLAAFVVFLAATGLLLARGPGCTQTANANLKQVKGVQVVSPAGHGEPLPQDRGPQIRLALAAVSIAEHRPLPPGEGDLKRLPLLEVPARGADQGQRLGLMAVMLSGDGGWAELDREVSSVVADHGIPVVGLNSLKYFWTARTPEETADDLAAVLRHYLEAWEKEKVILIGYSFGADVLPFLVNRLPAELNARIDLVVLLGPGKSAEFEFHLTNWLGMLPGKTLSTLPEVRRIKGKKIVCVFGEEEKESLCRSLDPSLAELVPFPGAHHFGNDYRAIAEKILSFERLEPTDH